MKSSIKQFNMAFLDPKIPQIQKSLRIIQNSLPEIEVKG